ncbi:hypothetical protein QGN29_04350 [Temperatibacter marinus]|uniref:Tetratricopeptide repeat protein n=1 Tax=Temperatibacter marinus TaxID=1456591 RepID=A0AA52EI55_9PROT|nr:hypothetical protein [Temperatibacter marinus]WND03603.1 hypothetical protein QGN29_04350 [Temperatibacter marinus]
MALEWQSAGGGTPARHCEALGLYKRNKYKPAGLMLDRVAEDMRTGKDMPFLDGKRTIANEYMLASVYQQAANAWLQAEDLAMAVSAADSAEATAPKGTLLYQEILADRARILVADENFEAAYEDMARLIQLKPEDGNYRLLYASAARMTNRLEIALTSLTVILTQRPDHLVALLERGHVYELLGRKDFAREDWLKIMDLDPDSALAQTAQRNLQRLIQTP